MKFCRLEERRKLALLWKRTLVDSSGLRGSIYNVAHRDLSIEILFALCLPYHLYKHATIIITKTTSQHKA